MRPQVGPVFGPVLPFGLALFLLLGASALGVAQAATGEPILFLGIQRHTATDRVASEQLMEYLSEHGESVLKSVELHDNERRCRHPQCLEALGLDNRAAMVVSGDVSSTGPNNTLRVQVHLYDVRRRGSSDAQAEMENLCADCDETKLGILLATTSANLIERYRISHPNPPPLPGPKKPEAQAQAQVPPAPLAPGFGDGGQDAPLPLTMSIPPAPPPTPQPAQVAPTPPLQQPFPPTTIVQQPLQPQLYPPPYLGPDPQAPPAPRKGMSRNRKIIAGVFGGLGIGALIVAGVMTGLDHRLAPNYSYNPSGTACSAPENLGKTCVLSTVGLYAPLYAVGGLLVGGMVLTLALPESKMRPPPPPQQDSSIP